MYTIDVPESALESGISHRIMSLVKNQIIGSVDRFTACEEERVGDLEEGLRKGMDEVVRVALEAALQRKADSITPNCPACGKKLTKRQDAKKTIRSVSGKVTITRCKGWCSKCKNWMYPADEKMDLEKGYTPRAQEMAALFASKMPIEEASKILQRATGMELPPASLDRLSKRVGKDAQDLLEAMDKQIGQGQGEIGDLAPKTLVIEIDAWNIRERDHWGESERLRGTGEEPTRWHWVWTGTVFSLDQRFKKGSRAMIIDRGYVATRYGKDVFREQLHAEAMRRGYGKAERVLIIADGAAWIWNLSEDRFPGASQRLDYYHLQEHLWEVAKALYPDRKEAEKWIKRKKKQLNNGRAIKVIREMQEAIDDLAAVPKEVLRKEVNYFKEHQDRMDYDTGRKRGEPIGSGAIESTCRQYQCRFKLTGQFWSLPGNQAIMALTTLSLNKRWSLLFPHAAHW
jgi:hypothetical protein